MTMFSWTWEEVERRVILFNRVRRIREGKEYRQKKIL